MSGERIAVSESEYQLLLQLKGLVEKGKLYSIEELSKLTGLERSRLEPLLRLLHSKGLVRLYESVVDAYKPTREGLKYLETLFPEEKLVNILRELGGEASVEELRARLRDEELRIALTNALRKKWVEVRGGKVKLLISPSKARAVERTALEKIVRGESPPKDMVEVLKRRKLIVTEKKRITQVLFPYDPSEILGKVVVEVGSLTRELLESGKWRSVRLKEYDVTASPPERFPGRLHFFSEFIEFLRDVMKELGFREAEDAPVELEFWNYDVLFQPQWHPARSPTDTYYLANPSRGVPPGGLAGKVKRIHELYWGYTWDLEKSSRLILRSHTTAVSARLLARRPKPPFRLFTIGRVYRVENIDPRHLPEFHQLDGIASEDGVSLRWLLGFLGEFFERIGIREYKFRPAYFPFTEPSVEGYVRVKGQWLEVLGAGMFRSEMLEALGVDYPVAAWGMGIERLAMALYDINDIRMLYSHDVRFLRSIPERWWLYASSTV